MKKFVISSVLILLLAAFVAVVFVYQTNKTMMTFEEPEIPFVFLPTLPEPEVIPVASLEEMVGQLFIIGHWAETPLASTTAFINKYQLGGVVIMSAPEDPTEIKTWTSAWNQVSSRPLFVAIDQEGRPASRLKGPDFIQTSQRSLTSTTTAYEVGKTRGLELKELGINMNFAPVLDSAQSTSSFMYKRVFPTKASSSVFAAAMIKGMNEESVLGVVKHFPGHDDTTDDSHFTLPTVPVERAELDNFTSQFRELIDVDQPAAMMTAHVLFPNIDDNPASLSSFFLSDYLRNTLGYTGLIITDDIAMDAITANWTNGEAGVQALRAGADIVLFAAEPEGVESAITAVIAAVETGQLSESRITESYQRVWKAKETLEQGR